ncbi:hypothetical protein CH330_09285 [candidate division WOR-3 bacterium JGI_Cruoil_03_51_56]|uniref:AraC effector-binding domain-containing protein n=1 Tax=candidate division WOR-3 bacterium JGI_Cruoil_03_51_56 TaxID=1973747 RepID=A0A235BPJ5_UNCW3|nr:MAG: hypothetical protein CH330_09285 [candidate division WOR-3 bacterium JGI_Cruoil_03_51_56]
MFNSFDKKGDNMPKKMVVVALAALLVVAFFGCGEKKQAKAEKPAVPEIQATVETLNSAVVASLAKTGPYAGVGQAINELFVWLKQNKIQPMGPPFGVYFDNPKEVKPESTRYEVCIRVPDSTKAKPESEIKIKPFGGMQVASTMYIGPYDKVGPTYGKLARWAVTEGYEVTGPSIEFYISDPGTTPAESLRSVTGIVVKPKPE